MFNVIATSLPVIRVFVVSLKIQFSVLCSSSCTLPLSLLLFHHSPWTITCMPMTHNFSSLSIYLPSTSALLSFSILFILTLNSSKAEFFLIGLPQQLAKSNTKYLRSLNLAIITFVNFAVSVLISTSKPPVSSQLSLAHAVTRTPKSYHITPVLKSLHWSE